MFGGVKPGGDWCLLADVDGNYTPHPTHLSRMYRKFNNVGRFSCVWTRTSNGSSPKTLSSSDYFGFVFFYRSDLNWIRQRKEKEQNRHVSDVFQRVAVVRGRVSGSGSRGCQRSGHPDGPSSSSTIARPGNLLAPVQRLLCTAHRVAAVHASCRHHLDARGMCWQFRVPMDRSIQRIGPLTLFFRRPLTIALAVTF